MERGREPRICIVYASSPFREQSYITRIVREVEGCCRGIISKGVVYGEAQASRLDLSDCDSLIVVVLTGGTENILLRLNESSPRYKVFVGLDKANSTAALIEASPILRRRGSGVVIPGSCMRVGECISRITRVLRGVCRIRSSRIGVIGRTSEWLVNSTVDYMSVESKIGATIMDLPVTVLVEHYNSASEASDSIIRMLAGGYSFEPGVGVDDLRESLRLYVALKELIENYNLNAVTIECFEVIREIRVSPCLPLAVLNSEGIPAACEGDIPSLLTIMIVNYCLGEKSFMANVAGVYEASSKILFTHCTAPLTMSCGEVVLKRHFESGASIAPSVRFRRGAVTITKLSPRLNKIFIYRGEVVDGEARDKLQCRNQMLVKLDREAVRSIVSGEAGNHHVILYGDRVECLKLVAQVLGLEYTVL